MPKCSPFRWLPHFLTTYGGHLSGRRPARRRGSARRCERASRRPSRRARSGTVAAGDTWPTPVANAKAAAEWPEGNERELGIRTWRAAGMSTSRRSGRRRRASGLTATLTTVAVTPSEASPWAAARRPFVPLPSASSAADANERRDRRRRARGCGRHGRPRCRYRGERIPARLAPAELCGYRRCRGGVRRAETRGRACGGSDRRCARTRWCLDAARGERGTARGSARRGGPALVSGGVPRRPCRSRRAALAPPGPRPRRGPDSVSGPGRA